jgi:hypothetical protein
MAYYITSSISSMKKIIASFGLLVFFFLAFPQSAFATVGTARPDGDATTNWTGCTSNGNGSCNFGVVDEAAEITGDFVNTGLSGTGGEIEEFNMTSVAGAGGNVSSVAVKFQAKSALCNGSGGSPCDSLSVKIFIDGAFTTAQTQVLTTTDTLYTLTFNGTWTGDDDLRVQFVRNDNGGGAGGSHDDDVIIYQAYADVTYTPVPTQSAFTNANRTITAGACSGVAAPFTLELRDEFGNPTAPTGSTVMRITSNTGGTLTVYSDSSCATPLTNGDVTFTTSDNNKTFYISDTRKSPTTWILTATEQSGPDTISNTTQTYTVNAGTVTQLVVTLPGQSFTDGTCNSGSVTNRTAGSSFTITKISATDAYCNVYTTYSGAKTLVYSGPGNAPNSQAPSYTTSVTFSNGQSTTTLTTTLYKAESTTITVTDGGLYGNASSSVTVDAGALFDYAVSVTTPQTAAVCFTGTNTVTARDQWQNTRTADSSVVNMSTSGTNVTFYTASNCNTSTTQYTMSSGTANIYIKTTKKQSMTVTATKNASSETGTSASITVNPGAVSKLVVTMPGETFTDGTGNSGSASHRTVGSSFNITGIAATDDNFNVNTTYSGSKTLVYAGPANGPDSTAPTYTTSVNFTSGLATTTLATTLMKAETTTITVTESGNYGNASSSFVVDPGAANNYSVSASSPQTAGSAFNVTITVRDAHNNNLGSAYSAPAGTYTFTSTAGNAPDTTAPSLGTLTQANFTNGVATKSVTLYKAESGVTFKAGEPSPCSVTGTSGSVTVNAAGVYTAAADSTITGSATGYKDHDVTITITLKDTYQNPKASVLGSDIDLSGTTATFSTTTSPSTTDASGVSTAALNWSTNGAKTVTATIAGVGTLSSTLAITISTQPPKSLIQGGTTIRGGVAF